MAIEMVFATVGAKGEEIRIKLTQHAPKRKENIEVFIKNTLFFNGDPDLWSSVCANSQGSVNFRVWRDVVSQVTGETIIKQNLVSDQKTFSLYRALCLTWIAGEEFFRTHDNRIVEYLYDKIWPVIVYKDGKMAPEGSVSFPKPIVQGVYFLKEEIHERKNAQKLLAKLFELSLLSKMSIKIGVSPMVNIYFVPMHYPQPLLSRIGDATDLWNEIKQDKKLSIETQIPLG